MKTPTAEHAVKLLAGQLGRIVLYCLSTDDAKEIADRALKTPQSHGRTGNDARAGAVYPMIVVAHHVAGQEATVNGRVFLDGNDMLWVGSRPHVAPDQYDRRGHWFEVP
jgi:hypothetical protein